MRLKRIRARIDFASRLGLEWRKGNDLDLFMRQCKAWHRLVECDCNGCTRERLPSESWEAYDKARAQQIEWIEARQLRTKDLIVDKARALGLEVVLQYDPRGCTTLFKPTERGAIKRDQWGHVEDPDLVGADVWNW